jgi:hypothetical protein
MEPQPLGCPDVQEIRSISLLLEPIKMFTDSRTVVVWGPNYKSLHEGFSIIFSLKE